MWLPKRVNKVFPLQRNKNRWKILVAIFSFRNWNEENAFGAAVAIFPRTNKISTEKSRRTNHASHIHSFVQLQNVSSQLYTFSGTQLKNCHLVLCSKRSFLSRFVKTIDGSPCCSHQATTVQHFSLQSPEPSAKRTSWETTKNNRTGKLGARALYIRRVTFFHPASHCSQL